MTTQMIVGTATDSATMSTNYNTYAPNLSVGPSIAAKKLIDDENSSGGGGGSVNQPSTSGQPGRPGTLIIFEVE